MRRARHGGLGRGMGTGKGMAAVLAAALVLTLGSAPPLRAATADAPPPTLNRAEAEVVLSRMNVAQLRRLGVTAVRAGRQDVALMIAETLRARDATDSFAHFLEAQAFLRAGEPGKARGPARRAFRHAETPVQKHEAARLAALSAAGTEAYLPAQLWMRRAIQSAPDEVSRAAAAQDFRLVRSQARLLFDVGLSVEPSDNVNGGASQEVFVVDGIETVGRLSPDARALSGVITRAHGAAAYRLRRTAQSETRLRGLMQVQRVTLSAEAQDDAPMADAGTYGYTVWDAGLDHVIHPWGPDETRLTLSGYAGQGWFAGHHSYDTWRTDVALRQPVGGASMVSLSYGRQVQIDAQGDAHDIVISTVRLGLGHRFGNDDRLALTLFAGETETPEPRSARTLRGATLRYSRAEPLGPVSLAGLLSAQEADYPDYPWLFGIKVPGGRQDTRLRAEIELGIDALSYMGFVPTVSVSHERTTSNVSRFETEGTAISLGFRSEF